MPHKVWVHACANHAGQNREYATEICPECNHKGIRAGWRYSLVEGMGAYQRFYRLKPIGPHRPLADQVLAGLVRVCDGCQGVGLLDDRSGESWTPCPLCAGTGRQLIGTPTQFEAGRQHVLERYPSASADECL